MDFTRNCRSSTPWAAARGGGWRLLAVAVAMTGSTSCGVAQSQSLPVSATEAFGTLNLIGPLAFMPLGAGMTPPDLGLRFRPAVAGGGATLDLLAWRPAPPSISTLVQQRSADGGWGARLEMTLRPATPGATWFDPGVLGMQLDNGARVSLRRKNGGVAVYYRSNF